jgi:hypothetical protein
MNARFLCVNNLLVFSFHIRGIALCGVCLFLMISIYLSIYILLYYYLGVVGILHEKACVNGSKS